MRVYIASLSDYNDGRLEGKWFDLSDYSDASDLMSDINDMLNELTDKYDDGEVREEWAVHDYEDIPPTLASEYMGEADFQQLIDIREFAEENNIPVEVLVERAGDTGSDDYQALAESLMFVVDGNDESDIVYEYESQIGDLGNEFWSNHIYVDDVTERVIYGEDVDRYRQDILDENPDMDEDEAERQAEEMADEEAERREDLATYLEEMGYGDEIPSWVSKDYEGAWKRSLSYDFDVIHHDGEMYVFTNNYSVGGTILSGMVGAYIGYKYAESKRKGKKLFAKGGGIGFKGLSAKVAKRYEGKKPKAKYRGEYGKRYSKSEAKEVGDKVAGKVYWQQRGRKFENGGKIQMGGIYRVDGKDYLFTSQKQNYEGDYTIWEAYKVVYDEFNGEKHINYSKTKIPFNLKMFPNNVKAENVSVDYFEEGGVIGQEIVFDDNGEENTGVIKDIHEITGDYIVKTDDGRVVLAQLDRDVISLGKIRETPVAKKRFGFFEDGGNVKEGKIVVYAENEEGYYRKISEHDTMRGAKTKMNNLWQTNEYYGVGAVPIDVWEKRYAPYQFKEGGSVSGLDDLIRG